MALPVAANYDPAVFDEPHTLKLDRYPNPHLSFSTGNHFCLGLQLAKVETQQALLRLYARFPDLRLAALDSLEYQKRDGHRALLQLPSHPRG